MGTDTELTMSSSHTPKVNVIAMSQSKVLITYDYGEYYELFGVVCIINGSAITADTYTRLSTKERSGEKISLVALSEEKAFVVYSQGSYLYGMICTISGTAITVNTDNSIGAISYAGVNFSVAKLSNSKVIIAHTGYNSTNNYYLYATIYNISGTSISSGIAVQLDNTENYNSSTISIVVLSSSKVFITCSCKNSYYLKGIICTIIGSTITKEKEEQLSTLTNMGKVISTVALSSSLVFVTHSCTSSSRLNGMICNSTESKGILQLQNSTDKIFGVAKTSGSAGKKVNIYTAKV